MGTTVRLRSIGDILIHMEIVRACQKDGSYDFSMLFENVKELFSHADILVGNMETILTDRVSPRGFPKFATPTAVGDGIASAGFDLVTTASNHTLDLGKNGMRDSVEYWSKKSVKAIGISSVKNGESFAVIEKNGIRIAFLNYTDTTNYNLQPITGEYRVNLMRDRLKSKIKRDIEGAKAKADFVVVYPHWGVEYLYENDKKQRRWAEFFVQCGADLIIGTHPHVVQNVEIIEASDGRSAPCLYSLGNFISCQKRPATMLGAVADVEFTVEGEQKSVNAKLIPIVSHTNGDFSYFSTYPLADYTDELASKSKVLKIIEEDYGVHTEVEYLRELYREIDNGDAQKKNVFQSRRQVFFYNMRRVLKMIFTGGRSAGRK